MYISIYNQVPGSRAQVCRCDPQPGTGLQHDTLCPGRSDPQLGRAFGMIHFCPCGGRRHPEHHLVSEAHLGHQTYFFGA